MAQMGENSSADGQHRSVERRHPMARQQKLTPAITRAITNVTSRAHRFHLRPARNSCAGNGRTGAGCLARSRIVNAEANICGIARKRWRIFAY
jgi:hypothetical protein